MVRGIFIAAVLCLAVVVLQVNGAVWCSARFYCSGSSHCCSTTHCCPSTHICCDSGRSCCDKTNGLSGPGRIPAIEGFQA